MQDMMLLSIVKFDEPHTGRSIESEATTIVDN